jgi:uncharacterized protein (TIGR02145 family)
MKIFKLFLTAAAVSVGAVWILGCGGDDSSGSGNPGTGNNDPNTSNKYAVTVSAGTGATGGGKYAEGENVTISAGTPPAGQRFWYWEGSTYTNTGSVRFGNYKNATTTFTMLSMDVQIKAFFRDTIQYGAPLVDARDGKTYRTVIRKYANKGDKVPRKPVTWMAENLNYTPKNGNSWCYNDSPDSCAKYGRLYDWATAMALDTSYNSREAGEPFGRQGVCPSGWYLPHIFDWDDLLYNDEKNDNSSAPNSVFKSESGWQQNGTDEYGFSALPGGVRNINGTFSEVGVSGYWWTAYEFNAGTSGVQIISSSTDRGNNVNKHIGYSVRCVKNQ